MDIWHYDLVMLTKFFSPEDAKSEQDNRTDVGQPRNEGSAHRPRSTTYYCENLHRLYRERQVTRLSTV